MADLSLEPRKSGSDFVFIEIFIVVVNAAAAVVFRKELMLARKMLCHHPSP